MFVTRYTKDHEWVRLEGDVAEVGVTDHAQDALGDIVFVELPEVDREVEQGEACAVVESVKAANDVYAPVSGRITEINQAVVDEPALINREPDGEGWFFKIELADMDQFEALMDEGEYAAFLETLE